MALSFLQSYQQSIVKSPSVRHCCPPFIRTLVVTLDLPRKSRIISLSQDPELNHICKVLFAMFSSVQSLSRVRLFVTPWAAAHQASPSITNSRGLLKLMSIESVMPSNHLILCRPLLLPSIFPSIRVFSNESVLLHQVAKVLEFQLQHQSFQQIFRVDFLED